VRIALDATYSVGSELTGIGVYSNQLIHGLATAHPDDRFSLCYRPKQFLQAAVPHFGNVRRRLLLPPLPLATFNIFHALNQRLDNRPARRVVSTFHDLFVMTSEYSSPEFRARFTKQARQAAAHSDLIIAVSEFTSTQIQNLLSIDRSRIRVIPHGVDAPDLPQESARENIILSVGALQIRKNVARLVTAFERVDTRWRLVLAGPSNGYGADSILKAIAESPARDRIEVTGHIPKRALDTLFRKASIFVFPSLDEGFGIPVLEAMAFGIPVITSNQSALPEVAGKAALLVDPIRTDEIEAALARLIEDAERRRELARLGHERALQFSWKRTVDLTYGVYRELA
jgi:glycosyltransferase involved in cell wall biosynthesis